MWLSNCLLIHNHHVFLSCNFHQCYVVAIYAGLAGHVNDTPAEIIILQACALTDIFAVFHSYFVSLLSYVCLYSISDYKLISDGHCRQISSWNYSMGVNWSAMLLRGLVVLIILTLLGNLIRLMYIRGRFITNLISVSPVIEERWQAHSKSLPSLIKMAGL